MSGRILALLILAAMAVPSHAEPYFAVQQGLKCGACHTSPTGGGLRNAFGNTFAQSTMAARYVDVGTQERWLGSVSRYLGIGTNVRANYNYVDVPDSEAVSEFDLQEARLYVELNAIPDRLSVYFDQRIAPGSSNNREAFARYWFDDRRWYVRAGQMYLPYGLRLEDDTAFIREVTAINFDTPDRGIEIGFEGGPWSAQLAVTNGTAGGPEDNKGKQLSLRGEFVQSAWRAGISGNFNDAEAGDRQMAGVFAGLRTGPISWLAEADYIDDEGSSLGEVKQLVGLLEANWLIRQGQNIKITAEYFEPDDDVDEDERSRYSAVWEWTPVQFVQLRVGARVYDGIPQNDNDNRKIAFAQVNAFF
jgi:phosphate-selective porin O/P